MQNEKLNYTVIYKEYIDELDNKVISNLYQPILGFKAISVYYTLISEAKMEQSFKKIGWDLNRVNQMLGMNDKDLQKSLEKLEAFNLLKRKINKAHTVLKFEILKPLNPSLFFENITYKKILSKNLDDDSFEALNIIFKDHLKEDDDEQFVDITSKIVDVFADDVIDALKIPVNSKKTSIDIEFLSTILYTKYDIVVNIKTKQISKRINQICAMYNQLTIEELSMIISLNFDHTQNIINWDGVEISVVKMMKNNTHTQKTKVDNVMIIEEMDREPFINFYQLRTQSTMNDTTINAIKKAQKEYKLSEGIINCVMDYVLIKNKGEFIYNYFIKVIDTVHKKYLNTTEEVMNFLKQTVSSSVKPNTKKQYVVPVKKNPIQDIQINWKKAEVSSNPDSDLW